MSLLIINYHYFGENKFKQGIYPITSKKFLNQIKLIQQNNWEIGNEKDLIKYINGQYNHEKKLAILTFDDGLKGQIDAVKILLKLNLSCICYIPTAPYLNKNILDLHKFQYIRAFNKDTTILNLLNQEFNLNEYKFDQEILNIQYRYDNKMRKKLNILLTLYFL